MKARKKPSLVVPLFAVAAVLRLVLIAYADWQDSHFAVKYTDVDYAVFTDAARFMAEGESPYRRATCGGAVGAVCLGVSDFV